ncbi:hypothetical protein PAXRUDRAFT_19870 [Paxillus rubicundulus Ve08.2h10]|uniref:Uncharacterized protein n=1 Tax=Paxillus rubicundulus Ve08.2h10 TaxID=930991 RepID=A0A0D0CTV0_9AGAM|nr:hypothetical protein PAXRUDRAFT_19870 [Paxillus rubicundulus Ve08.2h10]
MAYVHYVGQFLDLSDWNLELILQMQRMDETKGEKYLREFAEEIWRQCGMRVAVLTAWKDGSGQTMTTQYDINDQIEDGEAFNGNSDSGPVERKKQAKKGKKAKVDAVSMVSHIGKAWIGDIKDASLDVMKHMVWGFITFHYRRASSMKDGSMPWMQISTQRSDYISGKYLPQGAKLWEPFKLQKKEVISLLEFWRDRQKSDLDNVFTFRKWRGATGTLQDPVEVDFDKDGAS